MIVSKLSMEYIYQNMTQDEIEQTRFEYLMKRCKTGSVTLVEGITVEEASVIGENTNILKGIQISSGWSRQSMVNGQLGALIGKLTTKRQGLPTELKTELLAKGYTGNSRVGTSGLEKQYEDILKASNSSYSVKYIRTVNQQPFYGIMWPYLYLNPFVANKIDSAFILMQRVYCRIKKIGG